MRIILRGARILTEEVKFAGVSRGLFGAASLVGPATEGKLEEDKLKETFLA